MWNSIITTLGGTTILIAALTYLTKSIVQAWLSKSVESFKAELLHRHNIEVERLRTALQIQAQQEIAKKINLQQRQADAGPQLCRFLHDAMTHADFLLGQEDKTHPVTKGMIETFDKMHDALSDCYYRNYIYFPDPLMSKVDQIRTPLISIVAYLKFEALGAVDQRPKFQPIVDGWVRDKTQRTGIYASIESAVQTILGVSQTEISTEPSPSLVHEPRGGSRAGEA